MSHSTPQVKALYLAEFANNVVADVAEDLTSLQKLKIVPPRWLPANLELYANWTQLPLAFLEVVITLHKRSSLSGVKKKLVEMEVVKYVCDVGKALYDCNLIQTEIVFILSGLAAGLLSTHKQMLKSLK